MALFHPTIPALMFVFGSSGCLEKRDRESGNGFDAAHPVEAEDVGKIGFDGGGADVVVSGGNDVTFDFDDAQASDDAGQPTLQPLPPIAIALAGIRDSGNYYEYPRPDRAFVVPVSTEIALIGSQSRDQNPNGTLTHMWFLSSGPDGARAAIVADGRGDATYSVASPGDYQFTLRVENSFGLSASASVYVRVDRDFTRGLVVELTWYARHDGQLPDLDLHMLHEPGRWNDRQDDCYFANPEPEWDAPGLADDPLFDEDCNGIQCARETIGIERPSEGAQYLVGVDYRFAGEAVPTARIRVFIGRRLEFERERMLEDPGAFWEVAEFNWAQGISLRDIVYEQMPD